MTTNLPFSIAESGYSRSKRMLDLGLVLLSLPIVAPVAACVALAIWLSSAGPALYWSNRIGAHGRIFAMPKFRTMRLGTPAVATHLLPNAASVLTPIGGFLRKTSLDELPQLWSVVVGDMSLVGPRPALFNQSDLIALRKSAGVSTLLPGVTGLAQVNGRDNLPIPEKVEFDAQYLRSRSFELDLKILALTLWRVARRDGVRH